MDLEPLHPIQLQRFREMTPDEKWTVFRGLQRTARDVRRAALSSGHPDWDESRLNQEIAREFTRGRA